MLDPKTLFDGLRNSELLHGSMTQKQVDGVNGIIWAWNEGPKGMWTGPVYDADLAYILATIWHETARQLYPIHEYGGTAYFTRMYEHRRDLGNTQPGDGARYCGRGYVQITGRANYHKFSQLLKQFFPGEDVDIEANPDLALKPKLSAVIALYGMSHGTFTGRSLSNYIHGGVCDFVGARRIINPDNNGRKIAGYANIFLPVVKAATAAYSQSQVQSAPEPKPVDDTVKPFTVHLSDEAIAKYHELSNPDAVIEKALLGN
ncbi:MAG: hypothetical protein AAGD25_30845 [Cyanobacteria bacterium P01_F01_bin.150]